MHMPWGCSTWHWQVCCAENPAPEAKPVHSGALNTTVYYYIKNSINLIQVYSRVV